MEGIIDDGEPSALATLEPGVGVSRYTTITSAAICSEGGLLGTTATRRDGGEVFAQSPRSPTHLMMSAFADTYEMSSIVDISLMSACQALSVHPDRKYEVDGGPGAEQLGRLIREVAGDRDVARFFDALVYNWLVLATDGHAKNYSLLLSGHQVRLAPLYDVASALPHLDDPYEARMAQKIGGEYRPSFIQRRHWERTARSLGLGSDDAHARITALAERLPDALADAARQSRLTVDEQRIADTIRDEISSWVAARADDFG